MVSGGTVAGREGLAEAVARVEAGEASRLVVAKLDRATRSLQDFAELMARARESAWQFLALDLGVDTSTPSDEPMANVLASFSQFERQMIAQRTREALAVKRAEGVTLGRPVSVDPKLRTRIRKLRSRGVSLEKIAER